MQGCKNYKHCNVALLGESRKAAVSRRRKAAPSVRTEKPPAGRKTCLQVAFLIGLPVKSAFALLTFAESNKGYAPYPALITR
ncbi:hypothetical protein D7V86_06060 [bacterium D16-51]|nr:hypothetical protein D7V96_06615 [bacterium D16-59]RKI61343.1 hypothetical protein D7V86_06060 [bacterium D16-51]